VAVQLPYVSLHDDVGTGATYVGDPGDAIAMRDAMRQGSYIIVDGVQYPVAIDDGMAELTNADNGSIPVGSFASDIVILPLTVQGNKASLFWEYFDFSGPMAAFNGAVQAAMPLVQNFFWTDGGQYIWHMKPPTNWCVQWLGLIEPRVILLTPHSGWADQQHRLHAAAQRTRCVQRPA
jgi:hypothetical protein